jgi:hypothetical protein
VGGAKRLGAPARTGRSAHPRRGIFSPAAVDARHPPTPDSAPIGSQAPRPVPPSREVSMMHHRCGDALPILMGALLLASTLCSPAAAIPPEPKRGPWRLDDLLPERLSISTSFRTRYEFLDEQFRVTGEGDTAAVVLRTLVHTRLRVMDWFTVGAEFQDSRLVYQDDVPGSTTIVNAAELLRAYGELKLPELLGGELEGRFGRITMDVGSRRFVARNRFRNTLNAFTGVDVEWAGEHGRALRAFWVLPIERLPALPEEVLDNEVEFDHEGLELQFWGLFGCSDLPWVGSGELFVFGLHEEDRDDRPSRNRRIYTPGWRLFRAKAPGRFDYMYEGAVQAGKSRASTSATEDLDHIAHFQHVEVGYTFDLPWSPRVALQYDYASGDEDPDDGKNDRFDTLYGARRFDFGPTGIYGPFARSNINTPGIRIQVDPSKRISAFVAYRAFWLASKTDAWTTTGVRDPDGESGSHVGSQIEFRVRWDPLPGNLRLELGYAHLFAGEFIRKAPNVSHRGDSNYVYTQAVISF